MTDKYIVTEVVKIMPTQDQSFTQPYKAYAEAARLSHRFGEAYRVIAQFDNDESSEIVIAVFFNGNKIWED